MSVTRLRKSRKEETTMDAYICEYTDFMKNTCHKSDNTVESYTRDVTQYITYVKELGITDIRNTDRKSVV